MPDFLPIEVLQPRMVTREYSQYAYDVCQSSSLAQGGQGSITTTLGGTLNGNNGSSLTTHNAISNPQNGSWSWPVTIVVPANSNGLVIQQITRSYNVLDANGNPVQSADPKVNGATSVNYFEAWEVQNGVVGITVNGAFHANANDTFTFAAWPNTVASGTQSITGIMTFLPGASLSSQWRQDTSNSPTSWSGNLPYTYSTPSGWNPSGGIVRRVTGSYSSSSSTWNFSVEAGPHP